ncbi:hypothetical protein [Thermococcus sp. JCM 11816]|uniref:hypothetical protein n=1 Tax=Thermococcus sp. (strain JCM 11816 / KS-1) TaxID=1295125 RepID=UPI0006D03CEB
MITLIESPLHFAKIMKREDVQSVFFKIGSRTLYILTAKNLYADYIISFFFSSDGKIVLILRSGLVLKTSYWVEGGRTVFLTELNRLDEVIVM